MKALSLLVFLTSFSAIACPDLTGTFKCTKSDLWKTQYFKIEKIENGFSIQDKITVLDNDFNEKDVVRNYKHVLGESNNVINTGRFSIIVNDTVSCDTSSLIVESERTFTMTNEVNTFHTTYQLDKKGNLIYEGLEHFTCKRQ